MVGYEGQLCDTQDHGKGTDWRLEGGIWAAENLSARAFWRPFTFDI
jgi:hypothetical protein